MRERVKSAAIRVFPYLIIMWIGSQLSFLYRVEEGEAGDRILYLMNHLKEIVIRPFPGFTWRDLLVGLIAAGFVRGILYSRQLNAKNFRQGTEYGSARWGTHKDIAPYMDKDPEKNIILTATEGLTTNSRPKDPKYARNKNVLVIGGSGSGKTRFFVKPNLMQMHSSYCVTDPKITESAIIES